MQAITSVFRLEWASIKLANNAKTLQQPRWLASPSPLLFSSAPLGSWHAHEVQWKSIEILLRGRFICILSQVALAISRCHLHNRHHHPFGMTITCPEHVASIKKGKGVSRGRCKGGGDSGALSTCLAFIRSLKSKCYGPTRSYLSCAPEHSQNVQQAEEGRDEEGEKSVGGGVGWQRVADNRPWAVRCIVSALKRQERRQPAQARNQICSAHIIPVFCVPSLPPLSTLPLSVAPPLFVLCHFPLRCGSHLLLARQSFQ